MREQEGEGEWDREKERERGIKGGGRAVREQGRVEEGMVERRGEGMGDRETKWMGEGEGERQGEEEREGTGRGREKRRGRGAEGERALELHKCKSKGNTNESEKRWGGGGGNEREESEQLGGWEEEANKVTHVILNTLDKHKGVFSTPPCPFPIHWNHAHGVGRLYTRHSNMCCITTLLLFIILVKELAFLGLNTF